MSKPESKDENKGHLVASIKKMGDKFEAFYDGRDKQTFDTFDDANAWIMEAEEVETETPELPADEMTEEDAVAINSNVNRPPTTPGANSADIHA